MRINWKRVMYTAKYNPRLPETVPEYVRTNEELKEYMFKSGVKSGILFLLGLVAGVINGFLLAELYFGVK